MATLRQGAPGVRFVLNDRSQVDIVSSTNIVAGIVGFSSKGEFNKVIRLNSTSDMDALIGTGYNNAIYNQGLYATKAIIQSGGSVNFVRPYNEPIVDGDENKQELKSDAFLVEYNFADGVTDSINITHMAATRYYQDTLAPLGKREILTAAQTVAQNKNYDFYLDADVTKTWGSGDSVSLFTIVNTDPTSANRVPSITPYVKASSLSVSTVDQTDLVDGEFELSVTATEGIRFLVNDRVLINKKQFIVKKVVVDTLTLEPIYVGNFTITSGDDVENIASFDKNSGYDYLEIRTARVGKASKALKRGVALVSSLSVSTVDQTDLVDGEFELGVTATQGIRFSVNDRVLINQKQFIVNAIVADTLTLEPIFTGNFTITTGNTVLNLGKVSGAMVTSAVISVDSPIVVGTTISTVVGVQSVLNFSVGDSVVDIVTSNSYTVVSVSNEDDTITLNADASSLSGSTLINFTKSNANALYVNNDASIVFTIEYSPVTEVSSATFTDNDDYVASVTIEHENILIDTNVARSLQTYGLVTEDYIDIDFDGRANRVFKLTAEGMQVAKYYLFVTYFFNGTAYNFAGTVIPFTVGDTNLYIEQMAESVSNGWVLKVNENDQLTNSVYDTQFDLSKSVKNSTESGTDYLAMSYNATDYAVSEDAMWEYDPKINSTSSTFVDTWKLFLNKDTNNVDMLVSAGTNIKSLGSRGNEQLDSQVMLSMLDICEKRKDCFAIFDGIDEPNIENALKKMVNPISGFGVIGRWGAIFDGREIFFDADYTKLQVQAVKTVSVASIITLNRASNVYWLPPAGYNTGRIPGTYSNRQKFVRTFNYADDENSDLARLYDAHINPTRVNDQGQFIYGHKTMLFQQSALNRLNVIMLVAGIHKRFGDYLDRKVFQLNTAPLRNNIQSDLQAELEYIKSSNPAGITAGTVICDETNNTPIIIDTNQLIVDVIIQPSRSAEFITLRTTVQRTGDALSIDSQIVGG